MNNQLKTRIWGFGINKRIAFESCILPIHVFINMNDDDINTSVKTSLNNHVADDLACKFDIENFESLLKASIKKLNNQIKSISYSDEFLVLSNQKRVGDRLMAFIEIYVE
jgi:hypothetical protein